MIANLRRFSKLELGKEYPPKRESQDFQEFIDELKEEMRARYPQGMMPRQAHPKMHGLLQGSFKVLSNLPDALKVGVFSKEKEYALWMRLSSSNSTISPDFKGDIRGMAIKLMGVDGDKLITEEMDATTQDFILVTCETFISRNVKQFARTIRAIAKGSKFALLLYALNPGNWGVIARSLKRFITPHSLLDISYYSSTPYQFGSTAKAVKYLCRPLQPVSGMLPKNPDENYLKYGMVEKLKMQDVVFEFCVQFQENAYQMPIEDPTVAWRSEPIPLAIITIPRQEFDTDERRNFGENLSFNPWHALTEHRPLGGFNRARRWVYEAMAEFRHEQNHIQMKEPIDLTIPENSSNNNI